MRGTFLTGYQAIAPAVVGLVPAGGMLPRRGSRHGCAWVSSVLAGNGLVAEREVFEAQGTFLHLPGMWLGRFCFGPYVRDIPVSTEATVR